MTEENRFRLKDQIPSNFFIESSIDYPEDAACKVRGLMRGKNNETTGVLIEWHYDEAPDRVWLEIMTQNSGSKSGECLIENLKMALEGLI
jgi:hypothetical protein